MGAGYVNLRKQRKRQQRKVGCEEQGSSSTSGLCLGITRHPCDKTRAAFVRQPSAAESYKKLGR